MAAPAHAGDRPVPRSSRAQQAGAQPNARGIELAAHKQRGVELAICGLCSAALGLRRTAAAQANQQSSVYLTAACKELM